MICIFLASQEIHVQLKKGTNICAFLWLHSKYMCNNKHFLTEKKRNEYMFHQHLLTFKERTISTKQEGKMT